MLMLKYLKAETSAIEAMMLLKTVSWPEGETGRAEGQGECENSQPGPG